MITYKFTGIATLNKFVDGALVGSYLDTDKNYLDWLAQGNTPLPADTPTAEELRAAIQSQINALEAKYHMARPVREFMLLSSVEKAAALGYTEPQLYAANVAYRSVKDFDEQIALLRAEKDAII